MNRRNFFKTTIPLGLYPMMVGGLPFRSIAATSPFMVGPCEPTDRSMVVIFLNGGNDFVNTAVPLNQMSAYAQFRPDIMLPESSLITLDNSLPDEQQLGLHPALTDFKSLYDDGMLSLIQRVGYPAPNRSHFKSLDNMLTGSGGNLANLPTGWLGRFLEDRYPGYNGNPFLGEPDPLGILFGNMNKTGFHTFEEHNYEINLTGQDPAGFYTLISSLSGAPIQNIPLTEHGEMLSHIAEIENSVNVYAQRISETFNNGSNSSVVYPNSNLGNQLRTIARMLKGGSRTKLFMATTGGFDNHISLVDELDTTTGNHANLLGNVGASIKAFQDDLTALALDSNVLTVVFSEFGRKIIQNDSMGTDHGTVSNMFVVGKGVEGGVIGENVDLSDQDNPGAPRPSQLQNDYRKVFATLLQDWLGANDTSLESTFLSNEFYSEKLNLINESNLVPASCYVEPEVPIVCACIHVKVALEGFYDENQQIMKTNLVDAGLVPMTQPYSGTPFNYNGDESLTEFPDGTVDWLLVELRESADFNSVIVRKAVLLKSDGTIMEPDGTPGIFFENVEDGEYHLAIIHRTHLPIISNEPIPTDAPSFIFDFTQSELAAAGNSQLKRVGLAWCMIAGDADNNHVIDNRDFNVWKQNEGKSSIYSSADLNADGNVNDQDYNLWFENRSKLGNLK